MAPSSGIASVLLGMLAVRLLGLTEYLGHIAVELAQFPVESCPEAGICDADARGPAAGRRGRGMCVRYVRILRARTKDM